MAYGVYSDRGYREHILERNKNTNKTEVFTQEDQTFTGRKTFLSGVTTSDLEVQTVEVSESLKIKGKDITEIIDYLPNDVSKENKLTTEDFVNSSIATNTAYFRGTFESVEDLEAYAGEKTNNDYAFVRTADEFGAISFNRYKYNSQSESWEYEYTLNNSSFSSAQWDAINSGITAELVAKIGNGEDILDDTTVSTVKTWSSKKIKDSLDGKADKEELSKVENSGIADAMLINHSIGRTMSWSELEKAKTITYFTNWDNDTQFPSLYGSGVLIPGLDEQNKFIIYIDFKNIGYINIKTNLGWSGWKQLATTNAILDSLTVVKGNTAAQIIPWNDGTHYRGYEDTSNDIYTDLITKDGVARIIKIEHGTLIKNEELAERSMLPEFKNMTTGNADELRSFADGKLYSLKVSTAFNVVDDDGTSYQIPPFAEAIFYKHAGDITVQFHSYHGTSGIWEVFYNANGQTRGKKIV